MDTVLVNNFFHWVSLYSSIQKNLYGEDREQAMAVIEDDEAFDKWLQDYDDQQRRKSKNPKATGKRHGKEESVRRAKTYGGDAEG